MYEKLSGKPLKTREDITRFFDYLIKDEKANFHPDDNFETYIQLNTGKTSFEKSKAQALNARLQEAKKIAGNDVYAIAQVSTDNNYSLIKSIGNNINMKPRTMFADGGKMSVTDAVALHNINQWFSNLSEAAVLKVTKCSGLHEAKRLWKKMPLNIKEDVYNEFKNEFPEFDESITWGNLNNKQMEKERKVTMATGGGVHRSRAHKKWKDYVFPAIAEIKNGVLLESYPVQDGKASIYEHKWTDSTGVTWKEKYQIVTWGDGEETVSGPNIFRFQKGTEFAPYDPVYEAEKPGALDFVPEEDRWMEKGGGFSAERQFNPKWYKAKGGKISFDDLSGNEKQLLEILNKKTKSVIDIIERQSSREYDIVYSGTYSPNGIPFNFRAWLPLSAIRDLVEWNTEAVAEMSDYPSIVLHSDWSGIRDTNRESLWDIFETFVVNKKEAGGSVFKQNKLCPVGTEIQTLIFSKETYTQAYARKWANEHDFKTEVDETTTSYRFRQQEPNNFQKGSFRTIELKPGLKAVIGCPIEKHEQGGELVHPFVLKKIILQYNEVEDYSAAYKQLEKDGYNVAVVQGLELALMVKGSEIGFISISKKGSFDKNFIKN